MFIFGRASSRGGGYFVQVLPKILCGKFWTENTENLNFCISAELKMELMRERDITQNTEKQLQNVQKNKGEKEESM